MKITFEVEECGEGLMHKTVVWKVVDGQRAMLVSTFYDPDSLASALQYAKWMSDYYNKPLP